MSGVPNVFGSATSSIPLSQLDVNFNTPVTIGNTTVGLGNTVTSLGNVTLTNVTISSGNVVAGIASSTITQSMLAANVAGTGPAFSAYANVNQTLTTSTSTKIQLNSKFFDTANAFDSTTNYRFTPLVAGYYQINFSIVYAVSALGCAFASVKKNNADLCGVQLANNSSNGSSAAGSYLVYMNGSTDYLELFGLQTSGSNLSTNSTLGTQTYLNGTLVRAA